MLRFLILALLLTSAKNFVEADESSGFLQWRTPLSETDKLQPVEIKSQHLSSDRLGQLNLTTGELKLFSGHSLNILRSKCPNVNHHTLFKLQKYIGKRISESEPVQGSSAKLRTLLDKMMECASHVKFSELHQDLKDKVIGVDQPKSDERLAGIKAIPQKTAAPSLITTAKPVIITNKPTEKKQWVQMTAQEKTQEIANMFQHIEPTKKAIPTEAPKSKEEIVSGSDAPKKPARHPVMGWLSSIMDSVSAFFRGIFGFGRSRRSADFDGSDDSPVVFTVWRSGDGISDDDTSTEEVVKPVSGRQAFLTLFDEMCRIFCSTCSNDAPALDFKIAVKELLQFLFGGDSTGLDLAAAHYLNHEFLQSVQEC